MTQGDNMTLLHHLSYGLLEQTYPDDFYFGVQAAALQDHHWVQHYGFNYYYYLFILIDYLF